MVARGVDEQQAQRQRMEERESDATRRRARIDFSVRRLRRFDRLPAAHPHPEWRRPADPPLRVPMLPAHQSRLEIDHAQSVGPSHPTQHPPDGTPMRIFVRTRVHAGRVGLTCWTALGDNGCLRLGGETGSRKEEEGEN